MSLEHEYIQQQFADIKEMIRTNHEETRADIKGANEKIEKLDERINGRVRSLERWMHGAKATMAVVVFLLWAKIKVILGL